MLLLGRGHGGCLTPATRAQSRSHLFECVTLLHAMPSLPLAFPTLPGLAAPLTPLSNFKPLCLPHPTAGSRVGIQTTAPVIASELLLVSEPLAYTTAPAGTELRPVDLLKELQAKQPLPPADK